MSCWTYIKHSFFVFILCPSTKKTMGGSETQQDEITAGDTKGLFISKLCQLRVIMRRDGSVTLSATDARRRSAAEVRTAASSGAGAAQLRGRRAAVELCLV